MQYKFSLSDDGNYIIAKYLGKITREIAFKAAEESHAFAKEHGINLFLVDAVDAINFQSLLENYDFAYEDLKKANINRTACVALLVGPDDETHNFVETTLRNAGYNVTLFKDRERAIRHLLEVRGDKKNNND